MSPFPTLFIVTMLLVMSSTSASSSSSEIKSTDIEKLRIEIREAIDNSSFPSQGTINGNQPLIGSIVRLPFHDCVGRNIKQNNGNGADSPSGQLTDNICNGCFDFDAFDNAGLEENAYEPLEDIYQLSDNEWYKKMSRADFWAASATIAIEYAAENQYSTQSVIATPAPLPDIPYYFGREDCPRSPFATEQGVFSYPQANAAWQETKDWFAENVGYTARETVTILGAHTLGKTHADASGFVSRWTPAINILNSEYYANFLTEPVLIMAIGDFEQRRVGDLELCTETFSDICDETNNNYQWVIGPDTICCPNAIGAIVQLNSDISLVLDIEDYLDRDTGIVNCTAPSPSEFFGGPPAANRCPFNNETQDIVNEFALDNGKWLNEFVVVWEKMILNGLKVNKLQKLVVEYDRSFENTTTTTPAAAVNQDVGELRQNELDIIEGEDGNGANMFYYIGAVSVAVFLGMVIVGYVVYRYYKRRTLKLVKEIEECNNDGQTATTD